MVKRSLIFECQISLDCEKRTSHRQRLMGKLSAHREKTAQKEILFYLLLSLLFGDESCLTTGSRLRSALSLLVEAVR